MAKISQSGIPENVPRSLHMLLKLMLFVLVPSQVAMASTSQVNNAATKSITTKKVQGIIYNYSGDYYGIRWTITFDGTNDVLKEGDTLKFQIHLMEGYTESPVDVYIRINGSGRTLTADSSSNGVWSYTVPDIEGMSATSSGIEMYVASKNARYITREPIQPNKYTVTFDSDNGSTGTTKTVVYGNTVSEPTQPTKSGYTFCGWYTSDGTQYDFAKAVTSSFKLTAKWGNQYTVTFDPAVSGKSKSTEKIAEGNLATKPNDPTQKGYTFAGWYTSDGTQYDFSTPVNSDVLLTAHWTKKSATTDITTLVFSITNKVYTGSTIEPQLKIKDNGDLLTKDTDYTVVCSNNTNVGVASVTVTGIGIYTGSKTLQFTIFPKTTKLISAKSTSKHKITVKWKKAAGATGYMIFRSTSKNGKYSRVKSVTAGASKIIDKGRKSGKTYYYRLQVVKKSGSQYYASNYSNTVKAKAK